MTGSAGASCRLPKAGRIRGYPRGEGRIFFVKTLRRRRA
jgi:hypothetical protein